LPLSVDFHTEKKLTGKQTVAIQLTLFVSMLNTFYLMRSCRSLTVLLIDRNTPSLVLFAAPTPSLRLHRQATASSSSSIQRPLAASTLALPALSLAIDQVCYKLIANPVGSDVSILDVDMCAIQKFLFHFFILSDECGLI
jgi:hypothetical protein